MTGEGAEPVGDDVPAHGVGTFAAVWLSALDRADYVPLLPPKRSALVTALVVRLADALGREPFDAQAGYRVGADLVASGYASGEVIGCTITIINTRLAADLGLGDEVASRVTALVEALATGFAEAVNDRALDAQDEVRLAAVSAQARAERAVRAGEARFREFATHDALTGLPNRTLFVERLAGRICAGPADETTVGAGSRIGVCCLDLDGFAAVNDSLGHEVGDRLLVAVAAELRRLAVAYGYLVARLDSDQFAFLIEDTTCAEDAIKMADRALAALAEPFRIDGTELPLTASVGIVERIAAGNTAAELIRAAQIALHWAKADGRDCYRLFEPARSEADAERYRLSAAMPRGVRRDEFTLHYQPLVALADDRLVGVEALLRWHHPERGLLTAGQFIGLAEDTGLIVPLGVRLLAQACQQAARWQDLVADPPFVSVNIAPRHLQQPGLVACVAETLDRTGLAPHLLQLELVERAVIDDDETIETLSALGGLGVRIAIDDFGVGYSNLAALRVLPVHALKLDGTFAKQPSPERLKRDNAFLTTTVLLVHNLDITVTAEGIETTQQAARMRAAGCDIGQGWLFGRPVPAEELTQRLLTSTGD